MKIGIHPFSNGSKHGWSKLKSLFDFFFPIGLDYREDGSVYEFIRCETTVAANTKEGVVARDFYTFRALFNHYKYEWVINPIKRFFDFFKFFQLGLILIQIAPINGSPFTIPYIYHDSIAFDTAGNGNVNPGTSYSYAVAPSGASNELMATYVRYESNSDLDTITFNGASMTRVRRRVNNNNNESYCGYLKTAPSSGSHNVTVSLSSSVGSASCTEVLSGCTQSVTPDSSNDTSVSSVTDVTPATTVVAVNCWLSGVAGWDGGGTVTLTAGGSVTGTARSQETVFGFTVGDSNGTVSTGSQSMRFHTGAGASNGTAVLMSISPAPAAAGGKDTGYSYFM